MFKESVFDNIDTVMFYGSMNNKSCCRKGNSVETAE